MNEQTSITASEWSISSGRYLEGYKRGLKGHQTCNQKVLLLLAWFAEDDRTSYSIRAASVCLLVTDSV